MLRICIVGIYCEPKLAHIHSTVIILPALLHIYRDLRTIKCGFTLLKTILYL